MAIRQTWTSEVVTSQSAYVAWGSDVSNALAAAGWTQTNDTGQIVWVASVITISAAVRSGTQTTYTYTLTSGPALRIGMSTTITLMGDTGNNGTFAITGLGTGTFTVTNTNGVSNTGQSGVGTNTVVAPPTAPGQTAGYETWQSNDALSSIFPIRIRVLYYNSTTQYAATLQTGWTIGTATDGAGNLLGVTTGGFWCYGTQNGTSSQENDYFWYGTQGGNFAAIMQRGHVQAGEMVVIERSHDPTGADTAEYVTIFGSGGGSTRWSGFNSLIRLSATTYVGGPWEQYMLPCLIPSDQGTAGVGSTVVGGNAVISPVWPEVGRIANPMRLLAVAHYPEVGEGTIAQMTLYGATQSYIFTANPCICYNMAPTAQYGHAVNGGLLGIRWDAGA